MERKGKNAEWKRKQLNFSCRNETTSRISETTNGRQKAVITYYSYISLEKVPKSDEHQYFSKNAATPRATNFTLSTRGSYKIGGNNVVYTSKRDGSSFCHCSARKRPLGFVNLDFYGFIRSLITDEGKRNLL